MSFIVKMLHLCKCKWPKWPLVRKCCFCIPIRRGVIVFAYANLVFSLLSLPILIFLLVNHFTSTPSNHDNFTEPAVHLSMNIAFMCIDVILNVILLVGAHKRSKRLLLSYFYCGLGCQLLTLSLDLMSFDYMHYEENLVYLLFLSLNIYQLFLVYNTVYVIEENAGVQYVAYREQEQVTS